MTIRVGDRGVVGGVPTMAAVRASMAAQGLQAEGHITRRPTFDAEKQAATYERAMVQGAAKRIQAESGYGITRRDAMNAAREERAAVNAGTYQAPTGPQTKTFLQGVTNQRQARAFKQRQDAALYDAARGYAEAGDMDAAQGAFSQMTSETQQALLGDVQSYDYNAWYRDVKAAHGTVTTWPFSSGMYGTYYGKPAARYDSTTYAVGANAGHIGTATPTQTTPDSRFVYVLAERSAWAGAPQTMGTGQGLLNSLFTAGDNAADTLGLPSLAGIENFLKSLGKDALLLVAVGAAAWYLLHHRGGGLKTWE